MKYDIAVIIPAYNCENYIKECLEAIILNFNSKYKMQVIIIDDGSRDNTANICKDYQKRYRNITYKYQENQGVSVARNTGLYMTDAKFVMFVDADDILCMNAIDSCLDNMKNADFLIGGYTTFKSNFLMEKNENIEFYGNIKDFANEIEKWLYPPYVLSPWGKVFKNDIIKDNNIKFLRNINYGEDAIFVFEYLCKVKDVVSMAQIIYNHRVDNYNSLGSGYKSNLIDCDIMVNKYLEKFLKENGNDKYEVICNDRFVQNFSGNIRKLIFSDLKFGEKKKIFFNKALEYKAIEKFEASNKKNLAEKITYLALKYKKLYFLLYLHYVKRSIERIIGGK